MFSVNRKFNEEKNNRGSSSDGQVSTIFNLPTATPRRTLSLFVTHTRDDFITRDVLQSTIHSTVTPNLIVLVGLINSMCFSGINPIVFALFAQVKAKAIFSLPTIGHHSNSRVLQRMSSSGKGFQTSSRFAGKFAHSFT